MWSWAGSRPMRSRKTTSAMTTLKTLAITLLGASLAASPAIASAAPATAPVGIDGVTATGASDHAAQPQILVSFTDHDARTATDVVFVALDGNEVVNSFEDRGQFAPGVQVESTFEDLASTSETLRVARVTFADGTSWSATDAAIDQAGPLETLPVLDYTQDRND